MVATPQQAAEKWARRLKAAGEDIRNGVQNVTVAPSQQAIKKKDKMKAKLVEALDKGVWEKQLGKYDLESWKRDMTEKAIGRIPAGVDSAQPKMNDFMSKLLPAVNNAVQKIQSMPDVTVEDSVNRVSTYIREMSKFKYKG